MAAINQENKQKAEEGWKMRSKLILPSYSSTTKEKKICKKCNAVNAFFKIDCDKCRFKFTKTRADRGAGMIADRSGNSS